MIEEPLFEIAEIEQAGNVPIDTDSTYTGPESRRANRRGDSDRRGQIRFEIGKEDRRKNPGRRKSDSTRIYY